MGMIQDSWSQGMCRVEEGLFFGSDEFISLEGSPHTGYTRAVRCPISDLMAEEPDAWCALDATATTYHESHDLSIDAGGTSLEAEGFLALVGHSTGQLLWLLHLSASEPFTEVKIEGDVICAKSGGYPDCFHWRIPILTPEALTVVRG